MTTTSYKERARTIYRLSGSPETRLKIALTVLPKKSGAGSIAIPFFFRNSHIRELIDNLRGTEIYLARNELSGKSSDVGTLNVEEA
jgi:hypothetical protein